MRARTDGLEATSRFIAEFNSIAKSESGTQIIQTLHSDNAPELLSDKFQSLLLEHNILHRSSPSHIKQPNGIAERAIGTTRAIARSLMSAANAPPWTWGCAVLQAESILNKCNGPNIVTNCTADCASSFQLMTGQQPCVMRIMPFGCLAVATRPPTTNKITFSERGVRAINLGGSREQPGRSVSGFRK